VNINPLKDILLMKTFVLAAVAALGLGTAASAADFDVNSFTTTVTTGNLEFSASTLFGEDLAGFGDDFAVGAGVYVLPHTLGTLDAEVFVFGAYADLGDETFGALGAEYIATSTEEGSALEFSLQAAYVGLTDDFSNGDVILTPSVNLTMELAPQIGLFGELGNSWNASEDLTNEGGYAEVGLNVALTDAFTISPSVVQSFGNAGDDMSAAVEIKLNF